MSYRCTTLGEIRREIKYLQRRFARELAVARVRRVAQQISEEWAIAVANKKPKPDPFACVRKVTDSRAGVANPMPFHKYIESCGQNDRQPKVRDMVIALLPWAYKSGLLYSGLRWDPAAPA